MASLAPEVTLNVAADAVTSQALSVRLHSGAPGNAGTANRIGTVSATVPANGWTAADDGSSTNASAVAFGVLDSSNAQTVRAYSLWQGSTFRGWGDMASAVTVPANSAFTINANTIGYTFASA